MREAAVMTSILRIDQRRPDPEIIEEAVRVLDAEGVVMYPTESSYALGVNALKSSAILKVFEIKGRSTDKAIPVIVADLRMWKRYAYFSGDAETLVKRFMPGPLTLVLRKRTSVPDVLSPSTIAARIPGHPVALALVKKAGYPITSTSANISGQPPAYSVGSIPKSLALATDLILDAGALRRRKYSTIADLAEGEPIVTREGAIAASMILRALGKERSRK